MNRTAFERLQVDESRAAQRLTPRAYQSELFALARQSPTHMSFPLCILKLLAEQHNVIVRGDTGTGKTFVAAMVIKAVLATPTQDEEHKLVCFFAPKVALATQQYTVLCSQLPDARVKLFYGDMTDLDHWQKDKWTDELETADVIVSTPQVFLDVLRHGYWTLQKVSMLVFDEAHHASKRDPYALIMTEHYFDVAKENRPRVLGMTASPVYELRKAIQAIQNLESTLDARLVEVQQNVVELAEVARRPNEIVVMYEHYVGTMHRSEMEQILLRSVAVDLCDDSFYRQLEVIKTALGPLGGDFYILEWLKTAIKRARRSTAEVLGYTMDPALLLECETVASQLESVVEHQKPVGDAVSPKVKAVIDVISRFRAPDFVAVIFVQQRSHCMALLRILATCDELTHFIKPVSLTGHGGTNKATTGMPVVMQARVVNQMRNGEANVLVATQVAEEGMDFPACSLCIRFDLPQTLVSFIQSRGRARAIDATFVSLCLESTNEAETALSWAAQEAQQREHLRIRDVSDDLEELDLRGTPKYHLKSGAVLTHASAISLLNMVCSLLPHEVYETKPKPEFLVYGVGRHYVADCILPIMPKLGDSDRKIAGPPSASKMGARRSVAFKACIILHEKNILDEHMLPERPGQLESKFYADNTLVDRKPLAADYTVATSNVFGPMNVPGSDLFFHVLRFTSQDGHDDGRIGFIAAAPIHLRDPIRLYNTASTEPCLRMDLVREGQKLQWIGEDRDVKLEKLRSFNTHLVVATLNRHFANGTTLMHLIAPIDGQNQICWDVIERPSEPLSEDEVTPGRMVVTSTGSLINSRVHFVERWAPEFTPDSLIQPIHTSDGLQPANTSIASYFGTYKMYWQNSLQMAPEMLGADQPLVLCASPLPPRNMIVPWPQVSRETPYIPRRRVLPLCVLHRSRLAPSFWALVAAMPSWTRAMCDHIRVERAVDALHLPRKIPSQLILQALTLPQCVIGYDYETLETVGDTQLKLCTTVHVVLTYTDKLEGALSIMKHNSTDNLFLRKRGLDVNLGAHLISERFQAARWLPPTTVECRLSEDGLSVERVLKRRVFSDCCESILGAAWLGLSLHHGLAAGIKAVLDIGVTLGLHFGGTVPWADRMPISCGRTQTPHALKSIEKKLGYTFQDGRWLLKAITHRTVAAGHGSYEVVEYLGDALVDAWIVQHVTQRIADLTAEGLTRYKSSLASNGCLGYISLRFLDLPRYLIHSAPQLSLLMEEAKREMAGVQPAELFENIPFLEPPKVAADLVEALVGAVFLDSRCDLGKAFEVCDRIFAQVIAHLPKEGMPLDPVSALRLASDRMQCHALQNVIAERVEGSPFCAIVVQHGRQLGAGMHTRSPLAARQRAAADALPNLSTAGCDCPPPDRRKRRRASRNVAHGDADGDANAHDDFTPSATDEVEDVDYDEAYATTDEEDDDDDSVRDDSSDDFA